MSSKRITKLIAIIGLISIVSAAVFLAIWSIKSTGDGIQKSVSTVPSILVVTQPDGWNDYNIADFLMYIGAPFETLSVSDLTPSSVLEGSVPKYQIIVVYYAPINQDITKKSVPAQFRNAIMWAAGNGSTVLLNDFAAYWFQSVLHVLYTNSELTDQNVTVSFSDNETMLASVNGFGRLYPSDEFSGLVYARGNYNSYSDLIFLAKVPYQKGSFILINTSIMRLLWQSATKNGPFFGKMLDITLKEISTKIGFSFYGWAGGKETALTIRYDDIFPMEYPYYVKTIEQIDNVLMNAGLVATYGVTAFGSAGWNDTTSVPRSFITLSTGFPAGYSYSGTVPEKCWHASVKFDPATFVFFDSDGDGIVDRFRVDLDHNKSFDSSEEFAYNQTFDLGPYKMIWTNLDDPFQPNIAYINLANYFLDQYDNALIEHMNATIHGAGFKVAPHGITHARNKAWGEPLEPYFTATDIPIPADSLIKGLKNARDYLSEIFGEDSIAKVLILPWGGSTQEYRSAAQELGWTLAGDLNVLKYGQINIGATVVDHLSDDEILSCFIGFNATRGYFTAMNHPFSNSVGQYVYLVKLFEENRQNIWDTDIATLGAFASDRLYSLNLTQNEALPKLTVNGSKVTLEYFTPATHSDYVIRVFCNSSLVSSVEANRTINVLRKSDEWIDIEVSDPGPAKVELNLYHNAGEGFTMPKSPATLWSTFGAPVFPSCQSCIIIRLPSYCRNRGSREKWRIPDLRKDQSVIA